MQAPSPSAPRKQRPRKSSIPAIATRSSRIQNRRTQAAANKHASERPDTPSPPHNSTVDAPNSRPLAENKALGNSVDLVLLGNRGVNGPGERQSAEKLSPNGSVGPLLVGDPMPYGPVDLHVAGNSAPIGPDGWQIGGESRPLCNADRFRGHISMPVDSRQSIEQ